MAAATKVVEKRELKMFRIFIFLTQKNTKPEQKDGSITLEQDIQLKVFILKAKLFLVITFMPTVLKSIWWQMLWETHRRGETWSRMLYQPFWNIKLMIW